MKKTTAWVVMLLTLLVATCCSTDSYRGTVKTATFHEGGWGKRQGWEIVFMDGSMFFVGDEGPIQVGSELCLWKDHFLQEWTVERRKQ